MSKNIDKIIYINLEKRVDRREEIEKELINYNLEFERFNAIETQGFGILGCGLSHLSVFKLAKERNYKNVLILEDDFTFTVSKEDFETNLEKFFKLDLDYDVLFLSYYLNIESNNSEYEFLGKVIEAQTASGYLVNQKYYDKLIELFEWAIPLLQSTGEHWNYANDQVWKKLQKEDNWYYLIPRMGKQRNGYSDNSQIYINYDC